MKRAACGSPREFVRRTIPTSARKDRDHPSAKVFPDQQREPASVDVRSENQKVHADQHLLLDAPSGFRRGRQSHAVDQRRRSGERCRRLAQPKDVRRNRRRAEVARLDAAHPRHQRQRQARRMGRAQSAGRSDERQAHRGGFLRRRRESRGRFDVGLGAGISQRHRAAQSRVRIRRRPRWRKSSKCRSIRTALTVSAAWTSTATALSGRRCRAAIWRASTGASAKARSTDRTRPANIVPKAGRCYTLPGPELRKLE